MLYLFIVYMLYVVPTPVGNIKDITIRALELFQEVSLFLCEDTRTTKKLLKLHTVDYTTKDFVSLTSYTDERRRVQLCESLQKQDAVLVSEAGTPWLSDPGKVFLQECSRFGIPFTVLPGANALVPAIVSAWFPTHRFRFVGFLPQKKWKQTLLRSFLDLQEPVFFYESVHRIAKTLTMLSDIWYTWLVHITRELSKMHEQTITAPIQDILLAIQNQKIPLKGEFVVWLSPYVPHDIKNT